MSGKGIANVFGEFYSKLYDEDQHDETEMESDKNETENDAKETNEILEITTDELRNAIKRLKKGKAADKKKDLKIMRDTEGIIKADQQDMSTE